MSGVGIVVKAVLCEMVSDVGIVVKAVLCEMVSDGSCVGF